MNQELDDGCEPDRESSITASRNTGKHERRTCTTGVDRRNSLKSAGGLAATELLAGCINTGSEGSPDQNGGENGNSQQSVEEWLSETNNCNGITDKTGSSTVTVEVGPDSDEMTYAPVAIRVRSGTAVKWGWIGSGSHNVAAKDDLCDSGDPEKQASFKYAFDATGTTLYCDPQESAGMRGAVIVESGNSAATTSNSGE
ncbi:plastocyanin/azurin family copper-binding protein [Halosolutus gelatinilyticus]|uniref:plastocyanin/azurin family copper-binding protein n=1 Tax=Halosolutus gelatinilyticus TaxID=2931975 RepID=UPI001FF3A655|nr:plastocyanin/azurin family copper-binding protein [Halosolutus gelatinilyticus]